MIFKSFPRKIHKVAESGQKQKQGSERTASRLAFLFLIQTAVRYLSVAELCVVDLDTRAHRGCDYAALDVLTF